MLASLTLNNPLPLPTDKNKSMGMVIILSLIRFSEQLFIDSLTKYNSHITLATSKTESQTCVIFFFNLRASLLWLSVCSDIIKAQSHSNAQLNLVLL